MSGLCKRKHSKTPALDPAFNTHQTGAKTRQCSSSPMVKRLRIHHRLNVTVVAQDTRGPPSSGGGQRAPDGGDIDGSGESLPRPPRCAPGCGVHGTCDEWRSRCDCPIGFTGEACQIATLPACQLGNHLLPIRSWILLALFRLHRGGKAKEVSDRGIGPVPCACLHALVETPFLLERTRLEDLASFEPHCVHLPPSLSLKNFLTVPAVFTNVSWHRFSFAAALAAHRLQLPASLWSETVWPMNATLLASADAHLEQQFDLRFDARDRRDAVAFARRTVRGSAPPLLRSSPAPERSRLLPLDACSSQCGGRGWCAESAESGHGQRVVCGCFTPHGLYELYEEEGHAQTDGACPFEPRASSQPGALMLSPRCLIDCGGNGACDWMGFCKCKAGFWGPDCGVTHAAHRHSLPHGPRIVRAARDPSTRARPRGTCPRIHVPTLPPLLRFGISIGEELHHRLIERVLTSDCREPTLERADYVWLLAPQFAVHFLPARPPPCPLARPPAAQRALRAFRCGAERCPPSTCFAPPLADGGAARARSALPAGVACGPCIQRVARARCALVRSRGGLVARALASASRARAERPRVQPACAAGLTGSAASRQRGGGGGERGGQDLRVE